MGFRDELAPIVSRSESDGICVDIGSWHRISAKHLEAYLEEMTFRFNRRNSKTFFLETLQHMITADPLTFQSLTA